jgi:putative transposase
MADASPLRPTGTRPGSLGAIVQNFKSTTTRRINALRGTPGGACWQRDYYEHVIRDEAELARVREYVQSNPAQWALDPLRPARWSCT